MWRADPSLFAPPDDYSRLWTSCRMPLSSRGTFVRPEGAVGPGSERSVDAGADDGASPHAGCPSFFMFYTKLYMTIYGQDHHKAAVC